jgi:hypothetical protein
MKSARLLTVGPDNDPLWVRLYTQPYADQWAAMLVSDDVAAPVDCIRDVAMLC